MLDLPTRLVVAYGLIALILLATLALVWWRVRGRQRFGSLRRRALRPPASLTTSPSALPAKTAASLIDQRTH